MSISLKERAYVYMRDKLLTGGIPIGSRVSDVDIARELGISRTPVREAIARLESQGLIEQSPGMGPRVKVLDRRELAESFELREMLECGAVAIAAERATDQEVSSLEPLCRQYETVVEEMRRAELEQPQSPWSDRLNILDMAFHLRVIESARNRRLLKAVGEIQLLTRILQRQANLPTAPFFQRLERICTDHRNVVSALRRHDSSGAHLAMQQHIRWARDYHLEAFDWHQRQQSQSSVPGEAYVSPQLFEILRKLETGESLSPEEF